MRDPTPPEAPLPTRAQLIELNGRDPRLPACYVIPGHALIPHGGGTIYMLVYDWRKPAMEMLFKYAANMRPPESAEESRAHGECFGIFSFFSLW